jgi:FimV-like protein
MNRTNWLVSVSLALVAFAGSAAEFEFTPKSFDGLQLAQSTPSQSDTTGQSSNPNLEALYGLVLRNDNLWQILKRYRSNGVTMSQVMMSIYRDNRSAFDGNNINRLRSGVLLNIPTPERIHRIDKQKANFEVTALIAEYDTYVKDKDSNKVELDLAPAITDNALTEDNNVGLTGQLAANNTEQTSVGFTDIEAIKKELLLEQTEVSSKTTQVKKERPKKKPKKPLFRYSYDLSVANDDNIRRAQNEVDIRADNILNLTFNAKAGTSLSRFSLLSYGGSISAERFSTFSELDNLSFNANVRYRFAFASDFGSPIYSIALKVGGIESDKVSRDSSLYSVGFGLSKRMTNTMNMTLGIDYKQRESRSQVFDTVENRLFANLDINLSKKALLYSTYTYIIGDIVSSATPTLAIINASDAIEPDDAFGGITTNQFIYRLDSDTQVITLGYNHIITAKTSLDFSYRYVKTVSEGNIEYDRSIFRASLLGRF